MAIFSVTAPPANTKIEREIQAQFPGDYIEAWPGHWFISASGTAQEIAAKISIPGGTVGAAIVVSVANYWGRANPEVWEWLRSRLES
ncbi:MAG: hypothetical protein DMG21_00935 [Acidobacteria bacterium]|nr:MAG: hypothetical protein DMG21_00935 [Acidobacteriota bacterium]